MKTASLRVPFETAALKVAVVSSLLTLAACGGGGSSPSAPIKASADGARAPVVAAQGQVPDTPTPRPVSDVPQAQVAPKPQTQPQPQPQLQPQPQGNSSTTDANGSSLGAQNAPETPSNPVHVGEPSSATAGQKGEEHYIPPDDGPGVALAHKIMATCPVPHPEGYGNNGVWLSAPPLLACVAGSYTGTDLITGERCKVDISAEGEVRAERDSLRMDPFVAYLANDYAMKYGHVHMSLSTAGRPLIAKVLSQRLGVYFDPLDFLGRRKLLRLDGKVPDEALLAKLSGYFVVMAENDDRFYGPVANIWCGVPL
ncbi:hypothetical protein [Lautropia mirabilis]|uniref:hypothetical protein n=1 Tax=Lautropia mirabilis TaxID=47671 RepID=UPI0028E8174E|nr:hypothetical protein [Lautropia mirabilis]